MRARYWNLCKISDLLIYWKKKKTAPGAVNGAGFCAYASCPAMLNGTFSLSQTMRPKSSI